MKPDTKWLLYAIGGCAFFLLAVVCVAAGFNPFAWAWGLAMDLARAIGGAG